MTLTRKISEREMLEPEVAALAATNHTDSQLAAIEAAYMGMVDSTNTTDWNTNDVKFHLATPRPCR